MMKDGKFVLDGEMIHFSKIPHKKRKGSDFSTAPDITEITFRYAAFYFTLDNRTHLPAPWAKDIVKNWTPLSGFKTINR